MFSIMGPVPVDMCCRVGNDTNGGRCGVMGGNGMCHVSHKLMLGAHCHSTVRVNNMWEYSSFGA